MKKGWYFVNCTIDRKPKVIIAEYFGNGNWNTEVLEGEDYKVKRIIFPKLRFRFHPPMDCYTGF